MTDDNIIPFDPARSFVVTGGDYRKHAVPAATVDAVIDGRQGIDAIPGPALLAILRDWRFRYLRDEEDAD